MAHQVAASVRTPHSDVSRYFTTKTASAARLTNETVAGHGENLAHSW